MALNIGGTIIFFTGSYISMIISIAVFCIAFIVLIVKRKTLNRMVKIIVMTVAIIFFAFVCLSIYLLAVTGKNNQFEAARIVWTLDNNKILSGTIHGNLIKNNIAYKNVFMTVCFKDNNFIFTIYDNTQHPLINNAAYQIDNGAIQFEKGMDTENNVLKIEEDIFAPFLLAGDPFTLAFFDSLNGESGKYVFKLTGNNFWDVWSQVSEKQYEHLPVWESRQ